MINVVLTCIGMAAGAASPDAMGESSGGHRNSLTAWVAFWRGRKQPAPGVFVL
jgi:hypothetical protein